MRPRVFIGSSAEGLDIAYALQESLEYDAEVTVWPQGIFHPTSNTLNDLLSALDKFDFAIFVFSPDDILQIRGQTVSNVRDNVIFEFGLFIGRLGKEFGFFVMPGDVDEIHLPSDLMGIKPLKFISKRSDNNLLAALGPASNSIRKILKQFKPDTALKTPSETISQKIIEKLPEEKGKSHGKSSPEEVIGRIKDLTVLDLQKLVEALEVEFDLEVKSDILKNKKYDITLKKVGPDKIKVIKVIRDVTGLGLKEAKDLADLPRPLGIRVSWDEASKIKAAFKEVGAQAEITEEAISDMNKKYDVTLKKAGPDKIRVIKVIRDVTGLGLKEAMDLANLTGPLGISISRDEANRIKAVFEEVGAQAEII